ncbi:MAG: hypothetical protein EXR79_14435 [Myxococcales bacterium]|nr:hypothetical protein [Myxococcales bacterium]
MTALPSPTADLRQGARSLPALVTLGYVAALTVPLAVLLVICKQWKLATVDADPTFSMRLALVAADGVATALWLAVWSWLLHGTRLWVRRVLLAWLHIATLALTVLAVFEHGFWVATGSAMDWVLLSYTASHADMYAKIAASEIGPSTAAAFAGCVGLALWPLALRGGRRLWRASPLPLSPAPHVAGWTSAALVAFTAAAAGMLHDVPLPERLRFARATVPVAFVCDALRDWQRGPETEPDKPVQPLVVRRTAATKPRNVIVVLLESTRAQSTTLDTPALNTMPFLARLAREGVHADTAYTTVPHTTKCLVSAFCGVYPKLTPSVEEAQPNALPSECAPRVLRRLGWATGFFTPAELHFENNKLLVREFGFDKVVSRDDIPKGKYTEVNYFGWEDKAALPPLFAWIDQVRAQGPFFAGLLTVTSHHAYGLPKSWPRQKFAADPKLDDYMNTLAYADSFLQDLHAGLVQRGLQRDTILVVLGDHGEAFGEHGQHGHDAMLYEEAVRIPLVLWGPDVAAGGAGRVLKGLRQNVDVVPTLYELLGLDIVAGTLDGRSLLSTPGHAALHFACWQRRHCMARLAGTRKVIWNFERRAPEVFDLANDPSEGHDLHALGRAQPGEAGLAWQAMEAWRKDINGRYDAQGRRRKTTFVTRERPALAHPVDISVGEWARLIGWEVDRTQLPDGEVARIDLTFEVLQDPGPGWEMLVHAVHSEHFVRADHATVGGDHPLSAWRKGEFITDRTWLRIGPSAPAGPYQVFVGFYQPDVKDRPRATLAGSGLRIDWENRVLAATIELVNPDRPAQPVAPARDRLPPVARALVQFDARIAEGAVPPGSLDTVFGPALRLVAVDAPRDVTPGSDVTVTYHWCKTGALPPLLDFFVHLHGPGGRYLNTAHVPVLGHYPLDKWAVGECVADPHTVGLPADWPRGPLDIWLGVWGQGLPEPLQRLAPRGASLPLDAERRAQVAMVRVR